MTNLFTAAGKLFKRLPHVFSLALRTLPGGFIHMALLLAGIWLILALLPFILLIAFSVALFTAGALFLRQARSSRTAHSLRGHAFRTYE